MKVCAADKGCGKEKPDEDFLVPEEETGDRHRPHCKDCRFTLATKRKGRFCKKKYDTVEDYCAARATWGPLGCTSGGQYCGDHADKKTMFNLESPKSSKNPSGMMCQYGIGNGSTTPREFCGKEDCKYHFSYSFANFKGMMCGAKTKESCECLPDSCYPVVECWDEKQNGENNTPFHFAMKSNKPFWFLCQAGKAHPAFPKSLDRISRSIDQGTPICPACSKERQTKNQTHTTDDFVEHALIIYGERYGYERTVYKRATVEVIITCREHGDFHQKPCHHLSGHGCRECAKQKVAEARRLTWQEILLRARAAHSGYYSYPDFYETATRKSGEDDLKVICPVCGEFTQPIHSHLDGHGCKQCAIARMVELRRLSLDEIRRRCLEQFGPRICVLEEFLNEEGIRLYRVQCEVHGQREIKSILSFLGSKYGCSECANIGRGLARRTRQEEFVRRAQSIHKHEDGSPKYLYDKVIYLTALQLVTITCPTHGDFPQAAYSHLSGHGCPGCKADNRRLIIAELLERLSDAYGDRIRLVNSDKMNRSDLVVYQERMAMQCTIHPNSIFHRSPRELLVEMRECRKCTNSERGQTSKPAREYCAFFACGLEGTVQTWDSPNGEYRIPDTPWRADLFHHEANKIVEFHGTLWHSDPRVYAPDDVHPIVKNRTHGEIYEKTRQRTETLIEKGYNLKEMWELDWTEFKSSVRMLQRGIEPDPEQLELLLAVLDVHDSGQYNMAHLTYAIENFGCKFSPEQTDRLFDAIGRNRTDRQLSREDMVDVLLKLCNKIGDKKRKSPSTPFEESDKTSE